MGTLGLTWTTPRRKDCAVCGKKLGIRQKILCSSKECARQWRMRNYQPLGPSYAEATCKYCHAAVKGHANKRVCQRGKCPGLKRMSHYEAQFENFGLTEEQYDRLVIEQNGCCGLCNEQLHEPQTDHDHQTGEVRGLLCRTCNTTLGHIENDEAWLQRALTYMRQRGGG